MRPLLLLTMLILPAGVLAQTTTKDPVKWSAVGTSTRAGQTLSVLIAGEIATGWHIYSLTQGPGGPVPMRIMLDRGQGVTLAGPVTPPRAKVSFDSTFGIRTESYNERPRFTIPLRSSTVKAPAGFNMRVRYQACSSTVCMPARIATVAVRNANSPP